MSLNIEVVNLALLMLQKTDRNKTLEDAKKFIRYLGNLSHGAYNTQSSAHSSALAKLRGFPFTKSIVDSFSTDALINFAGLVPGRILGVDKNELYIKPLHKYMGKHPFYDARTGGELGVRRTKQLLRMIGYNYLNYMEFCSCVKSYIINSDRRDLHEAVLLHNFEFYNNIEDLGPHSELINDIRDEFFDCSSFLPHEIAGPDAYVRKLISAMASQGVNGFYDNYNQELSKICGHHIIRDIVSNSFRYRKIDEKDLGEIAAKVIQDGGDWYKGLFEEAWHMDDGKTVSEKDKFANVIKRYSGYWHGKEKFSPIFSSLDRDKLLSYTPTSKMKKMYEYTGDKRFARKATKTVSRRMISEELGL